MKKLFSVSYSAPAFDIAMLILRLMIGGMMVHHGYSKLMHFSEVKGDFIDFMGLGTSVSLSLVIFAELFCSLLLIFGFMTRLAVIPLMITLIVAVGVAHHFEILGKGELGTIYFAAYVSLLILGPGSYSMDSLISRRLG